MKEITLGVAVTLTATLTSMMGAQAAQAQETSESIDRPESDLSSEVMPVQTKRSNVSNGVLAQPSQQIARATVEVAEPTIEFSAETPAPIIALADKPTTTVESLTPQSSLKTTSVIPEKVVTSATAGVPDRAALSTTATAVTTATPAAARSVTVSSSDAKPVAAIAPPVRTVSPLATDTLATGNPSMASIGTRANPTVTAPPEPTVIADSVQEKIQQLEQQQLKLQQELNLLRQQVSESKAQNLEITREDLPEGLTVTGQALFLKPRNSNIMDFARVNDSFNTAVGGRLATVDYDQSTAWRVGVNYAPKPSPWELGATYTFFSADDQATATEPLRTDGTPGRLLATYAHPFQNQRAASASAEANLDYDLVDLDVAYNLRPSKNLNIKLFTGLQIANLDQAMAIRYDGQDFSPNGGTVNLVNDFDGIGPKLGAEMRLMLGSGFSVYGRGSAALLFGNAKFRYQETFGSETVADLNFDRKQTLPTVNFAVGVDWTSQLSKTAKLSIGAGYEYQHWFNATRDIRFVDDASPAIFAERQGDLSMQGFFVKAGISFVF
ncbi:Lpg1974 family pore-forming outer membrane protein [Alkalinema sp. FACHB-956]|uniref:Lpg1974 family pore-forming outer membrane protein n=1 Tax=Alkalinema sp. FACHB-956 TaxID=2692768 RepID=UPI001684E2F0|nr:Lpg1974 family pore-forming outer membrane protein [Alkalinema sp. FACHB-956]MBD2327447.1 hypothetical protein [Alkalinema sp. FACHB-956]